MRLPTALAALLLLAPGVCAAGEGAAKPETVKHYIDIPTVALPIIWRGRLVNYVFTNVRVNLAPSADATKLGIEKEPFLRDALVRVGHSTPLAVPWRFTRVDERALLAAMRPQAERVLGRGLVVSLAVTQATPKQVTGLPEPPRPPAPAAG